MKHNLIKTDNYLLVVDNSEIKSIDWVYVEKYPEAPWKFMNPPCPMPYWGNKQEAKKIIAHLPLNGAPYLDGVDVLPSNWRDSGEEESVEQLAQKEWGNVHRTGVLGFIDGCKKTREKYKFTEEDARHLIMYSFLKGVDRGHYSKEIEDRIIQTIQQHKLPIAFECEMIPCNPIKYTTEDHLDVEPKTTTNSEGRIEWVGKYIYN